jgi:hypothetical protein
MHGRVVRYTWSADKENVALLRALLREMEPHKTFSRYTLTQKVLGLVHEALNAGQANANSSPFPVRRLRDAL